jgi:hypothetical protein
MRIASPKDFWAGVLFAVVGGFACIYAGIHYNIGTAQRMGPGYFPLVVGGIVAVLSLVLIAQSLRIEGPPLPSFSWRPVLFVLGSGIAYGYLLKPLGLVIATLLVVLVTAAGGHEFRWKESVVLAVALAAFSVGIFVYALGLPFPLWPEVME